MRRLECDWSQAQLKEATAGGCLQCWGDPARASNKVSIYTLLMYRLTELVFNPCRREGGRRRYCRGDFFFLTFLKLGFKRTCYLWRKAEKCFRIFSFAAGVVHLMAKIGNSRA